MMSTINTIQNEIMQLSGGEFEKLFDAYLYKKYKFTNIQTLGVQTGTNKPTKGTPDSYVINDDGKYILITCGSVKDNSINKIKKDIQACFDKAKLSLDKEKIFKIICGHTSTNIHPDHFEDMRSLLGKVQVEPIGIDTISHDLFLLYPNIAKDFLNLSIDSHQIFDIDDFVSICDKSKINAPIGCDFLFREKELKDIVESINQNDLTIVMGPSGIGKTRLVLEACRKFRDQDWKVLCVKSNSNLLYDDIRYYVSEEKNYLLFFDDANLVNSLEGVLDYLFSLPEKFIVKIIFTVRDYAKKRIADNASKYSIPKFVSLTKFNDNEIKEILKSNLGIVNNIFLDRISKISDGNIRVAMLAGMKSVEDGFEALKSVEDVFKNYYGKIIDDALLDKNELIMLFNVVVSGPVRKDNNRLYTMLLEKYSSNIDEKSIIQKLYELELVDWFKNEIINISDQSLGDYIIYYVFFEKKWVELGEIIELAFPEYREKIIYIINTLYQKFYSEELNDYVKKQIKDAWNKTSEQKVQVYLESFYLMDPIKSLSILKNFVDNSECRKFTISKKEIEKKKNHNIIKSKQVELMSGYKYTDQFEEALDLFIIYYDKRPDLFFDFYYAIINNLLYDKNSYNYRYKEESTFLSKIWLLCEDGKNYKYTILYLHIVEYALNTEFDCSEGSRNGKVFSFCRMTIILCDEIKKIRSNIWKTLFLLRKNKKYTDIINNILTKRYIRGFDDKTTQKFLKFDFDEIYQYIENDIDYTSAKIIDMYKTYAYSLKMNVDYRMLRANENEYFRIYSLLNREHLIGRTIEEDNKIQKEAIRHEISNYTNADYDKLFDICMKLAMIESDAKWDLGTGISIVFELLESDSNKYKEIITLFFKHGAPIETYTKYKIVGYMIETFGYLDTKNTICKYEFDNRTLWLECLWEIISEEDITNNVKNDFWVFMNENENIVPPAIVMSKFCKIDSMLLDIISERLINSKSLAANFLRECFREEDVILLIDLYHENIDLLCKIYLNALNDKMDFEGNLFWELYIQRPEIWNQYIDWLKDNFVCNSYEQNIIERIWSTEDYSEKILYAFNKLTDSLIYYNNQVAFLLFAGNCKKDIKEKKQKWLLEELKQSVNNFEKIKKLIYVVAIVYPEWEIEYILEFLKINKSVENFKELYLFPLSEMWSGSEIPRINKKIDFLNNLNIAIRGIEYLEHKSYLNDRIDYYENYKEQVELREYIENACNA